MLPLAAGVAGLRGHGYHGKDFDMRRTVEIALSCVLLGAGLLTAMTIGRAPAPQAVTPTAPALAPTATPLSTSGQSAGGEAEGAATLRETRALWVSRWDLKSHPDVAAIVERAAEAHFNVIFFQVRGQADALYTPGLEPWSADLSGTLGGDPGWDPLAEMVAQAHARGIEVQAWVNVYPVWLGATAPPASASPEPMYWAFNGLYGNEWLQWQGAQPPALREGEYLSANPAHPAVVDHIVAVCKDILARYAVDGLHLDYVRYAGPDLAGDPVSEQAYQEALARDGSLTRADWQRAQVTGLVRRVRDEALPVRPGARLTTTAWPVYKDRWGYVDGKDGYSAYYQDSQAWARDNLVSAIVPMLYGPSMRSHPERYAVLARDYVEGASPGSAVLGIGADQDSFASLAAQIDTARAAGARGQAIFSYDALESNGYWAALAEGPYREPALPNWA